MCTKSLHLLTELISLIMMNRVKADFCMGVGAIAILIGLLVSFISVIACGVFMTIGVIFLGIAIQLTIKDED